MRIWSVAVALLVVLAGCSGKQSEATEDDPIDPGPDGEDGSGTGGGSGGGGDGGSGGGGDGGTPGDAPGAVGRPSIAADITEGASPLAINVSLASPGAVDASWTLDDESDEGSEELASGSGLPTVVPVVLAAGEHVLRLTVSAAGESAEATLAVSVDASAPGVPEDHAIRYNFSAAFEADPETLPGEGTQSKQHTFDVPEGAYAVTAVLSFQSAGTPESMLDGLHTTEVLDLDLVLTGPDGAGGSAETTGKEFLHVDAVPGTWSAEVVAFRVPDTAQYELEILVWQVEPQIKTFDGEVTAGFNVRADDPVPPLTAGDGIVTHPLSLPSGMQSVAASLQWTTPETDTCDTASDMVDMDLYGLLAGTVQVESDGFSTCEHDIYDGTAAGDWSFEVVPFTTVAATYELTVIYG